MADNPWRVNLDVGELYPFVHESRHGVSVPTSAEQVTRWRKVMADFAIVQDEMKAAYDEARNRDALAAAEARADQLVEEAKARLAKTQYVRAHPPWLADSWTPPGNDDVCAGWQYGSREEAKVDRMALHNNFPDVRFDLKWYVCQNGHHHLRRRA